MVLFENEAFNEGSWESGLRSALVKANVISATVKVARFKEWRGAIRTKGIIPHWFQFEPVGWPVGTPTFGISKPAVLAWDDVLYAGYYVERGRRDCKPNPTPLDRAMWLDHDWHWHSLVRTIRNPEQRQRLIELMERLPEENRCIWFLRGSCTDRELCTPVRYGDAASGLEELERLISDCEPNDWIDLMFGVRFTLDECLELQDDIVAKLYRPLTMALTIERLVLEQQVAGV